MVSSYNCYCCCISRIENLRFSELKAIIVCTGSIKCKEYSVHGIRVVSTKYYQQHDDKQIFFDLVIVNFIVMNNIFTYQLV